MQEGEKKTDGIIRAFRALVVVLLGVALGYFVYTTTVQSDSEYPFKLGLDLAGGSHLVYTADVSSVAPEEVSGLMNILKDVIERRINIFGVSEPIIQVEESSFAADTKEQRLVVELPGVTDIDAAVAEIGRTPLLEFKLVDQEALAAQEAVAGLAESASGTGIGVSNIEVNGEKVAEDPYIDTGLTGRYLTRAELVFGQASGGGLANEPIVSIQFSSEGGDLFEEITRNNVNETLAIFLDGEVVSAPRINEPITGGSAIISGNFTPEEARDLVQNLNFGALPLPISLQSTQTIGASLGADILDKGIRAGGIGLSLIILFMLVWYRLPGAVAGLALLFYTLVMLSLFKLIPVTLTAAGLAGFVISLGMAVDANVLVFERMKEEYRNGKGSRESARVGFQRAWSAIRDGNLTSLFSAMILFWFGTSIVKGFALVFGLGVLVSMLSALMVTRTLLVALPDVEKKDKTLLARLIGSGIGKHE